MGEPTTQGGGPAENGEERKNSRGLEKRKERMMRKEAKKSDIISVDRVGGVFISCSDSLSLSHTHTNTHAFTDSFFSLCFRDPRQHLQWFVPRCRCVFLFFSLHQHPVLCFFLFFTRGPTSPTVLLFPNRHWWCMISTIHIPFDDASVVGANPHRYSPASAARRREEK